MYRKPKMAGSPRRQRRFERTQMKNATLQMRDGIKMTTVGFEPTPMKTGA